MTSSAPLDERPGHDGAVLDASFLWPSATRNLDVAEQPTGLDGDRSMVSVGDDKTVRIWKPYQLGYRSIMTDGQTIGPISALEFSHDSRYLLYVNADNEIPVWDIDNETILYTFDGHPTSVKSIRVAPDSGLVASLDIDGRILLWSVPKEPAPLGPIETSKIDAQAKSIAFTPDGSGLAVIAGDDELVIYDLVDLSPKPEQNLPGVMDLFSTADSLLGVFEDGMIREIIAGKVGQEVAPTRVRNQEKFAICRNGNRFVKSRTNQVELWGTVSGTHILDLRPEDEGNRAVESLAFSPDGKMIAMGDQSGEIQILGTTER